MGVGRRREGEQSGGTGSRYSSGHPSFCSEAQHSFWYKESTKLADENDLLIGNRATTKTEHNFYKKKFFPPNWENKLSRNSYQ